MSIYVTPEKIVEFINNENMKTFKKFWMVFVPSKNAPTKMYFNELEAETEAKRLAVKESTEAVVLVSESVFEFKKTVL